MPSFSATSVGKDGTIQTYVVPTTGSYVITAYGAEGGGTEGNTGLGAKMSGTFSLTQGDIIKILVGQYGGSEDDGYHTGIYGGGGGGSFVVKD